VAASGIGSDGGDPRFSAREDLAAGKPPPDSLEFPVAVLVTVAGKQEPDAAMPAMDDTL